MPALDLHCRGRALRVQCRWYGPESGSLIWLQHGFARRQERLAGLAGSLAERGHRVLTTTLPTLEPHGWSLVNVLGNEPLLRSLAAWFDARPERLILAGHSAGGEAAAWIAAQLRRADLAGVILLDPVPSIRGDHLRTGLAARPAPTYAISSPPSRCNRQGTGTRAVQTTAADQSFVGIELRSGCHNDAEGDTTTWLARAACGTPDPANVAQLRDHSGRWADDLFAGRSPDPPPETPRLRVLPPIR